jgi:hypothetical protein
LNPEIFGIPYPVKSITDMVIPIPTRIMVDGIFTLVAIKEARNIVKRKTGITYSLDSK